MVRKYQYGTEENRKFLAGAALEFLDFGKEFPSEGGSSWYLGDDGKPWKDRPRETWITSRMAHVYSIGSLMGVEGSEALAKKAVSGLMGELLDKQYGGWHTGIRPDGTYLPEKQCYAHNYVMLAGCSSVEAGIEGGEALLKEAVKVYDEYFWDEKEGLARDTWNTEFTECADYRGLNANMHSVEALMAVFDATGKELYRDRSERMINRVIGWAKECDWRIPEHFTGAWERDPSFNEERPDDPFKPYGAIVGHGMEWSRLIIQWAYSRYPGDENARRPYLEAAVNMYRRAAKEGWNVDGNPGMIYTTDWEGKPVVHDRMHWTLAEAINTSATLHMATGDPAYADDYAVYMDYLDNVMMDHERGSWYHQLDRENKLAGTVWPGKSDLYHGFQAMLIPYYDLGVSLATAVKRGLKR